MLEVDCLGWCWPGWALSSRRPWSPWGLALLGLGLAATRLPEWLVVLLAGLLLLGLRAGRLYAVEPLSLLWFFLLVGSTLFGSGYVLVGLLQEMVHRGWLSATDLLTALSLGQITPGPLLTTATAAGYLAAGVPGAILATLGIFLPSFVLTALVVGVLGRLEGHPLAQAFLQGASGAALGLIGWALWLLGQAGLSSGWEGGLALLALLLLKARFPVIPLLGLYALGGVLRVALMSP